MTRPLRHPEEFTDTDPKTMEVWIAALRAKSPGERLDAALQLSELALSMNTAGARTRFPQASDHTVRMHVAATHLSREQMVAVYGWDPAENGDSI